MATTRSAAKAAAPATKKAAKQAVTEEDLIAFVYAEARLLDDRRLEDWLDLFAEDGRYWLPAEWPATDPLLQPSFLYEDRFLLDVRIRRLAGKKTYSQKPPSRGVHVLQRPTVEAMDASANLYKTYTPFHYVEARGEDREFYDGWAHHELTHVDGALKIRLKKIDLVNIDGSFGNIQLFI